MMMMVMVVMGVVIQRRLLAISQGKGTFSDPIDGQIDTNT